MYTIILTISMLTVPRFSLAAAAEQKTFTGLVTQLVSSRVVVKTNAGVIYAADIGSAVLTRKNGAAMQLSEILPGDRVEVKGTLWGDNSFSAASVRNLSLFAHNSTFSGKIVLATPSASMFTMQNSQYGLQTINTNSLTGFKKNNSAAALNDLQTDMVATVKGVWERSRNIVFATAVSAKQRLVSIDFTGSLLLRAPKGLTIVVNDNTIYGIDITNAKIKNKSGKIASLDKFILGDIIKISGKHPLGGLQVTASIVQDLSLIGKK